MLTLPPGVHAAPPPQHELLPKLLNAVFKWKWLIVLVMFAVAVPVALVLYMKTPLYEVRMKILIKSARAQHAFNLGGQSVISPAVTPTIVNSEIQLLRSPDLLLPAIQQSGYPLLGPDQPDTAITRERAFQGLRARMNFNSVPDSNVIDVSIQDPDARQAARLLNTLATLYLKKHAELAGGGREHPRLLRHPGPVPPGQARSGPARPRGVPGEGQHHQHRSGDGAEPPPAPRHGGHPQGPSGRDPERGRRSGRPGGAAQGPPGRDHQGAEHRPEPRGDGDAHQARRPRTPARRVAPALHPAEPLREGQGIRDRGPQGQHRGKGSPRGRGNDLRDERPQGQHDPADRDQEDGHGGADVQAQGGDRGEEGLRAAPRRPQGPELRAGAAARRVRSRPARTTSCTRRRPRRPACRGPWTRRTS